MKRALTLAGTHAWLVGYDINGIQELITASSRPILMRGASQIIGDFDGSSATELTIFAGDGRGVELAPSQEAAAKRIETLVRGFRDATQGGVLVATSVPYDPADAHASLIDAEHPLLKLRDGRTGYLGPRLREAKLSSEARKALSTWAAHLGTTEAELLDLLDHLELLSDGGASDQLKTSTADRMAAVGLRSDGLAVEQGAAAICAWVTAGTREVDRAALEAEVTQRGLRGGEARATLLVNAIDRLPWADAATVSLDWVDHFEGSSPRERVQLRDPAGWTGLLTRELEAAEQTIRGRGFHKVEVRGFMRLPVWFAIGATFADTRGFRLTCEQRGERWSTEEHPSHFEATVVVDEIAAGEDLAIGLSIARDLGADVRRYIAAAGLPVRRFVHLAAAPAPSNQALVDAAAARALAAQVRDLVAAEVGATGALRVHLFLAMPGGAALLVGHVWNRLPATQVYEDLGPGRGYAPTFLIPG